jgi:hypothetical protein
VSESKALRRSVSATQQQMADEMAVPLTEYRRLERLAEVGPLRFREATFAAMRIAVIRDGGSVTGSESFFVALEELLTQFERSRPLH